jgi:hypothetical protein
MIEYMIMENGRGIFLQEINEFIILSKNILDKNVIKIKYLELVRKYHPDVNNEIDKTILNEYMVIINNSYEKIKKMKTDNKYMNTENKIQSFNFDTFMLLLKKVGEMGINKETIKDRIFNEYKNLLMMEIEKSSKYVAEAIKLLFSDKVVNEYGQKINLFNNGIVHYMYLLKNVPSSTKEKYKNMPDIKIANKQGERVADSYFNEYKDYCKKEEEKDAIEILKKWFKETNKKYKNN